MLVGFCFGRRNVGLCCEETELRFAAALETGQVTVLPTGGFTVAFHKGEIELRALDMM